MKEIIEEVKQIIKFIRSYGTDTYFSKHADHDEVQNLEEFLGYSNEGMKRAQDIILVKLTSLSEESVLLNQKLKSLRNTRPIDSVEVEKVKMELKANGFFERIYRKLADAMVWQIFGGRRELIARHYLEEEGGKSFSDNGFKASLSAAREINKDPLKFALLTDLTSNIQVGDLLVWGMGGIEIHEIKTGNVNKTALDLFHFYDVNELDPIERIDAMPEGHFKKQMKRMLKQKETNIKTAKILQNDTGEYQKDSKTRINLKDSHIPQKTYHKELLKLIQESEVKKWACTSIEGIISVGVYREEWREGIGETGLKNMNKGYPVYDLRGTLDVKICESIFSKPFSEELIADIAFGKIQVLIGIDYDALIDRAKDIGLPLRWSTSKELAEVRQASPLNPNEILSIGNKGLVIDDGKKKAFVGAGFMIRLVFDHLTPTIELANRLAILDSNK
ncbi:hypothetical protein [Pedobacter sp. B4-66]|uniref:hypothetical protein n=1 Tax=Pedobacter sp. B4-66 TaxID=2817280 RepID=UPI001BDA24E6|nr:hypothetical protein [Pedobacter sp. B4-66]